jgi:lipopolysaccharide biosynthesis protein
VIASHAKFDFQSVWKSKETITTVKRQTTKFEETFDIYRKDRGLICRIYIELKTINTKGANNPFNRLATELNRPFFKVLMANNIW